MRHLVLGVMASSAVGAWIANLAMNMTWVPVSATWESERRMAGTAALFALTCVIGLAAALLSSCFDRLANAIKEASTEAAK